MTDRRKLVLTLIMPGKLEEARRILAANWWLNAPPHANTKPRIAFLRHLIAVPACFDGEVSCSPLALPLGIDHAMSARAKVFMNGRSQAIRLPKNFRGTGGEVLLKRVPEGIVITEHDPWEACEEACHGISDSFFRVMENRNTGLKLEKRAWRDDA